MRRARLPPGLSRVWGDESAMLGDIAANVSHRATVSSMAFRHTFRSVASQARTSPAANLIPQPTNRQLTRTETKMLTIPPDGQIPSRPTVLGEPTGDDPVQVYSTGMFMSLRKGETRWVTGSAVEMGLDSGSLMLIGALNDDDYHEPTGDTEQLITTTVPTAPTITEPTEPQFDASSTLADMSKSDLVKLAQMVGLEGRSGMDKSELYEHLRRHPDVQGLLEADD